MAVASVAHAEDGLGLGLAREDPAARELVDGEGLAVLRQHHPVGETLSRIRGQELLDRPVSRDARGGEVRVHQPALGILDRDPVRCAERDELERVPRLLERARQ